MSRMYRALGSCMSLRRLNLSWCGLNDEGLEELAEVLPTCSLEDLGLNGNAITVDGACVLADALPGSKLTRLSLDRTSIGQDGVLTIKDVMAEGSSRLVAFSHEHVSG